MHVDGLADAVSSDTHARAAAARELEGEHLPLYFGLKARSTDDCSWMEDVACILGTRQSKSLMTVLATKRGSLDTMLWSEELEYVPKDSSEGRVRDPPRRRRQAA